MIDTKNDTMSISFSTDSDNSSAEGADAPPAGGPNTIFYLMWFSLVGFLVICFWKVLQNGVDARVDEGTTPNGDQTTETTTQPSDGREKRIALSSQERRDILLAYFESTQKQMVSDFPPRLFCCGSVLAPTNIQGKEKKMRATLTAHNLRLVIFGWIFPLPVSQHLEEDHLKKILEDEEMGQAQEPVDPDDESTSKHVEGGQILLLSTNQTNQKESEDGEKKVDAEREYAGTCAICLEPYMVGDLIVWSSNPDCPHVFHRECLLSYLCKVKGNRTPCPCCRREGYCENPFAEMSEVESSSPQSSTNEEGNSSAETETESFEASDVESNVASAAPDETTEGNANEDDTTEGDTSDGVNGSDTNV